MSCDFPSLSGCSVCASMGVTAFLAVALDKTMRRKKATEHAPDVAPRRLRDLHPLDALTVLLANFKVRDFRTMYCLLSLVCSALVNHKLLSGHPLA